MSDNDFEALKRDVQKILFYLNNDEDTGEKGLVAAFRSHEKEFKDFKTKYEKEQAEKKAKMGVYGAIGGAILTFLIFVGKSLFGWIVEHVK